MSDHVDQAEFPNLQPAFQRAIDHAGRVGAKAVRNDLGAIAMEMWAPLRTKPFGSSASVADNLDPEGVPLVVRHPMSIDFAGALISMKGPGGGERLPGQIVEGGDSPWLGGWLYAIGGDHFTRLSVLNVTVDGGYHTDFMVNENRNLTDKGFRLQDTWAGEVELYNVELRNFGAEIYYIGGLGPDRQRITDCHFHGSPQSAFNPGGVGYLSATRLEAGRSYQAAEILGGKGHRYNQTRFYDSGSVSILGGPSPTMVSGYPFWYPMWDGKGDKPWIDLGDARIENCRVLGLGSWIKGAITAIDTEVFPRIDVGRLCDINLEVLSVCDEIGGIAAIAIDGPRALDTPVPGVPGGAVYEPPRDFRLRIHCQRTENAVTKGNIAATAARFYGGLVDAQTMDIEVSGEMRLAAQLHGEAAPGFIMPTVIVVSQAVSHG